MGITLAMNTICFGKLGDGDINIGAYGAKIKELDKELISNQ